ncbi:MAG: ABC transporter permease [Amylibacter sp.]|nr:ABC transporter permease [Amylibacter sp.]MDG1235714.1 ABC transporter permease [Amylibacter sp.]MDG1998732.1 ABC transporter permease [Amylibacter sp.]
MRFVVSLVLRAVVVLTGAALATFSLLWNAPGDPALAIALARFDALVPTEVIEQVRTQSGLDVHFWPAFLDWIAPLLSGDFGQSSVTGRKVWPELISALFFTVPLAFLGLFIGLWIAIPLALIATRSPGNWLDRCSVAIASIGAAIPAYWLGLLLILLFAVQLRWLPAMGARTQAHVILPAVTLGLGVAASLTRILRSGILEARKQPFLPAIRRRGVAARDVERHHIALHAAIPVVTVFGLELAFLLEGAVIVEVIFARPGLGSFLINAIEARDFPKVQAVVVLATVLFVTLNFLIDVFYQILDPRIGRNNA